MSDSDPTFWEAQSAHHGREHFLNDPRTATPNDILMLEQFRNSPDFARSGVLTQRGVEGFLEDYYARRDRLFDRSSPENTPTLPDYNPRVRNDAGPQDLGNPRDISDQMEWTGMTDRSVSGNGWFNDRWGTASNYSHESVSNVSP